jgi:hypothetical protein
MERPLKKLKDDELIKLLKIYSRCTNCTYKLQQVSIEICYRTIFENFKITNK